MPTKTFQTYNKKWIDDNLPTKIDLNNAISDLEKRSFQVVATKPSVGEEGVIYLIKIPSTEYYDQWIYENGAWINLGSTRVCLDDYYTKVDSDGRYVLKDIPSYAGVNAITTDERTKMIASAKAYKKDYAVILLENQLYELSEISNDYITYRYLTQYVEKTIKVSSASAELTQENTAEEYTFNYASLSVLNDHSTFILRTIREKNVIRSYRIIINNVVYSCFSKDPIQFIHLSITDSGVFAKYLKVNASDKFEESTQYNLGGGVQVSEDTTSGVITITTDN